MSRNAGRHSQSIDPLLLISAAVCWSPIDRVVLDPGHRLPPREGIFTGTGAKADAPGSDGGAHTPALDGGIPSSPSPPMTGDWCSRTERTARQLPLSDPLMTDPPTHWKSKILQALRTGAIFVMVAFLMVAFLAALYGPDYLGH